MGQQLDLMSPKKKLQDFDMDLFSQIAQFKTSYYSFYLPVQLSMILARLEDPELYRQAQSILLDIGQLYQVQNDYMDCYGDAGITGRIGQELLYLFWILHLQTTSLFNYASTVSFRENSLQNKTPISLKAHISTMKANPKHVE